MSRRTNTTHLVTANVNDPAIVRADNRRDSEKGNYRGIKKERREGEARRGEARRSEANDAKAPSRELVVK